MNQFLRAVTAEGLPLEQVTAFKNRLVPPKGTERIASLNFEDRVVDRDNAHIRGVAAEVLSAAMVLRFFCEVVQHWCWSTMRLWRRMWSAWHFCAVSQTF